jgi:hypothetical protein
MADARAAIVRTGLVKSLNGTVRIDANGDPVVDVDWLNGATLWLLSDLVEYNPTDTTTTHQHLVDRRRTLDDVAVDDQSLTTVTVRESSGPGPDTPITDLVVHVPEDARIWAVLGRFALANRGDVDVAGLRTRGLSASRSTGTSPRSEAASARG